MSSKSRPARTTRSTFSPSGRIWGQMWACSPRFASSFVNSSYAFAPAGSRASPPLGRGAKMIEPSGAQVPPMETGGASARAVGAPPESATFFNSLPTKNASHSPSGEKKGSKAPSVPGIGTASARPRSRR